MTVPPSSQFVTVIDSVEVKKKGIAAWCASNWKALLAEFLASSFLVHLGCMGALPIYGLDQNPALYAPLGFGFMILFNIQSFGHISGAHMNPALTLIAVLWGNMSVVLGIAYVIVQCLGAVAGYGVLIGISPYDMVTNGVCASQPHPDQYDYQALITEIILTAALAFLTCSVWDPVNKNKQDGTSIKFGLTVAGLAIVGGTLTGASMNPARSFGPALWTWRWNQHWIYWAGPLIGGAISGLLYKYAWLVKEDPKDLGIQKNDGH